MKTISTLLIALVSLIFVNSVEAQMTYSINANNTWSAKLPATCYECTINIATGMTLTINEDATCQDCTINGGTISMTSESLNIQYTGSTPITTYFNGVNFQIAGTGSVTVNAPISISNSTFTFSGTSSITTSYAVNLTSSAIHLDGESSMVADGSAATDIDLMSGSEIEIGNGSTTNNTASLLISGPTLNIYGSSAVVVAGNTNSYQNWANYNTASTPTGTPTSYSTNNNNLNCGGHGQSSCSNPYVYGPATLASGGTTGYATLPLVLVGFTATLNNNKTVILDWNTQMEVNTSHFDIERSADGSNWNTIGAVAAAGSTSTETNYSFSDENPLSGINYYRLKMVDRDSSYGYTEIQVLRTMAVANISFFPNPARDYVNVSLGETTGSDLTIRLINQSGQVLQEKRVQAGNGTIVSFPLQQYAAGLYILSVSGNNGLCQSNKILISRS
jgi:type IX secretion system substrate protein